MSTHPKADDVNLLSGSLALEPGLPGPTDLPRATDMPATADTVTDTVTDPTALAARLTGAVALRDQAGRMIEAGAPAERVAAVVMRTEIYARAVTDLLDAVNNVIKGTPGALIDLAGATTHLARIEQEQGAA